MRTPRFDRFSPRARAVLAAAQKRADKMQHAQVTLHHVVLALLEDEPTAAVLGRKGLEVLERRGACESKLAKEDVVLGATAYLARETVDVMNDAEDSADRDERLVHVEDLVRHLSTRGVLPSFLGAPWTEAERRELVTAASPTGPADEATQHDRYRLAGHARLRALGERIVALGTDVAQRRARVVLRAVELGLAKAAEDGSLLVDVRVDDVALRRARDTDDGRDACVRLRWSPDARRLVLVATDGNASRVSRFAWTGEAWQGDDGADFFVAVEHAIVTVLFPELA